MTLLLHGSQFDGVEGHAAISIALYLVGGGAMSVAGLMSENGIDDSGRERNSRELRLAILPPKAA
jgi:hypothetical protein